MWGRTGGFGTFPSEVFKIRCEKEGDLLGNRDREDKEIIGELLFSGERIQDVKDMLGRMWRERDYRLKIARQRRNGI